MSFSGRLRSFAQDLAPDHYEVIRAGETIDVITRAIHAHFKGRGIVDRITPFGSYPKKTSISGSMDVDVIVYINNQDPPFSEIIGELYKIVHERFDSRCRKDSYGVYFYHNGLKVDLLPAKNFLPFTSSHDPYVDRSISAQHARALDYVKSIPLRKREWYSTSLSGISVLFEQNRDSFSHSVSRLSKYWSSKVPVAGLKPQSSIMEYLGAYAAEQERYNQDIYKGFKSFLKLLESSDSINVYWTEFYREHDIPYDVRTERPLLLDPCNPYNNLLNIKDNANVLRRMRPYARETLDRLDEAFHRGDPSNIENIFQQTSEWSRCPLSTRPISPPSSSTRMISPQPVPFTTWERSSRRSEMGMCPSTCGCRCCCLYLVGFVCLFVLISLLQHY